MSLRHVVQYLLLEDRGFSFKHQNRLSTLRLIIYFSVSLSHRRSTQFLSKLNPLSIEFQSQLSAASVGIKQKKSSVNKQPRPTPLDS